MKDTKLTLLQYNMQKSQSVQELLLATSALQEVDIIALQKPWKNPHIETSTSTVFSSFLPLYCSEIGRTLFLINKNLKCCGLYCAVLTEYRIKGEMWKVGWFSQERSVKECEGVWWNVVVVTPDQ